MKRLKQIQKELAHLNGYEDFNDIAYKPLISCLTNEAIKQYVTECCQKTLEEASNNLKMIDLNKNSKIPSINECWVVDKDSITNPDNIVLL